MFCFGALTIYILNNSLIYSLPSNSDDECDFSFSWNEESTALSCLRFNKTLFTTPPSFISPFQIYLSLLINDSLFSSGVLSSVLLSLGDPLSLSLLGESGVSLSSLFLSLSELFISSLFLEDVLGNKAAFKQNRSFKILIV